MIDLNPSSNLLEQDPYEYELQDVPEAHLFRDIYPNFLIFLMFCDTLYTLT